MALVLLTVATYGYALVNAGFVWDDDDYVTANETLRTVSGLRSIWFEPGATPQYYPLTFSTLWLNYQLGGLQPLPYHLVNILLHAANAALLWRILCVLAVPGAWLGAALFAVHPLQVESVVWIAERKNVLSGTCALGATLAYLRYAGLQPHWPAGARSDYRWAALLFCLGLLSKTVIAPLPVVLAVLLWWQRGRVSWRELRPLLPLLALAAGAGTLTAWLERIFVGASGADWTLSSLDRVLLAGRVLWFYVWSLLWPFALSFNYPRWVVDAAVPWQYLFPVTAAVVIGALTLGQRRFGRGPAVAVLCYALTLAPALGFFDVFPMRYAWVADHFAYHASMPLLALAGAGGARLGPAAFGVLPVLAAITWHQSAAYHDTESLWMDTVAKNPSSWMAHNNLGLERLEAGRLEEASTHFLAALAAKPDDVFAIVNLGMVEVRRGNLDAAATRFEAAIGLDPAHAEAHSNLGNVRAAQQRYDDAVTAYRAALRSRPRYPEALNNLANVLVVQGQRDEAIAAYEAALQLDPDYAEARRNLVAARAGAAPR